MVIDRFISSTSEVAAPMSNGYCGPSVEQQCEGLSPKKDAKIITIAMPLCEFQLMKVERGGILFWVFYVEAQVYSVHTIDE